jgi:hypothetical protein
MGTAGARQCRCGKLDRRENQVAVKRELAKLISKPPRRSCFSKMEPFENCVPAGSSACAGALECEIHAVGKNTMRVIMFS